MKRNILLGSLYSWLILSLFLTACVGTTSKTRPTSGVSIFSISTQEQQSESTSAFDPTEVIKSTPEVATSTGVATEVIVTPTPSFEQWSRSSQPDKNLTNSAKTPYLQALGLREEDVILKTEVLNGVNGQFAVMIDQATGTPLLIANGNRSWEVATPKNLANAIGFKLSVALGGYGSIADYNTLVKLQKDNFNSGQIYFGSQMWIGENEYNLSAPQSDANIGDSAGMKDILGMNLLWANDAPDWLKKGNYNPDQMKQIIQNYLEHTVGYFSGKVNSWVIVNEFDYVDSGTDIFKKILGDEYIDFTFAQARALDKNATLIYNDWNNETVNGGRYQITKQIIDKLKANDPNIAVGLQMHLLWNDVPDARNVIEAMRSYDVPVYITEFDVRMEGFQGTLADKEKIQAEIYKNMVSAAVRSGVVKQFNIFGLIDRLSVWEAPGRFGGDSNADPLIFHDNFSPKQSYYGILAGLVQGAQSSE